MTRLDRIPVVLEIGQKRTFASAIEWPGWCRSGRDESSALQALVNHAPRYALALQTSALLFTPPSDVTDLTVVERLVGNATTDFGAPSVALAGDAAPVDPATLERWQLVLKAIWQAFDSAVQAARGKPLSKGPRGGGRELLKIVQHVIDADLAYLSSLGGKPHNKIDGISDESIAQLRQAILSTLVASAHGEVPRFGPRGGARWPPRFFVRRLAWHELDHAWEIEDRLG